MKIIQNECKDVTNSSAFVNDSVSVVFDTAENLELWRRQKAAIRSGDESLLDLDEQLYFMEPPPKITVEDTEDALRKIRTKKIPGFSEISVEILRAGGKPFVEILIFILQ